MITKDSVSWPTVESTCIEVVMQGLAQLLGLRVDRHARRLEALAEGVALLARGQRAELLERLARDKVVVEDETLTCASAASTARIPGAGASRHVPGLRGRGPDGRFVLPRLRTRRVASIGAAH